MRKEFGIRNSKHSKTGTGNIILENKIILGKNLLAQKATRLDVNREYKAPFRRH